MDELQTKSKKRILAFNPCKKLIGVFSSQVQAARILKVATPTVKSACDGATISTCGLYLRWWNPDIEINVEEEMGSLTLREYDALCGVKRKVYSTKNMSRKGWKYNMQLTPEKLKKLRRKNESTNCQ